MDIRGLLRDLVAFPTSSAELPIQLFLKDRLAELGFAAELQEVFPNRPNLVARRGHGGPLLSTHVDVFPAYEHPSPFELREEGDLLIGRGIVDTKGQIAALLLALERSAAPCQVALTVDEERQGRGSECLDLRAEGAVVLEPTGLAVAVAEAGFLELEVVVPGRPAHGTIPERGENAILKAFRLYEDLTRLPFMRARHPLFPSPWANLGLIEGGVEPGVVPFHCRFLADLAILPGVDLEGAIAQVEALACRVGARVTVVDRAPGFEIPRNSKVARTVTAGLERAIPRRARLAGMRSWTDAANFVAKGIPSVILGAGDLAIAHSDREVVSLDELILLSHVLSNVIEDWSAA